MALFGEMSKSELIELQQGLLNEYNKIKANKIQLDMSRGKPSPEQLNLSNGILSLSIDNYIDTDGNDVRNYGVMDGIRECRELFSKLLNIPQNNIIIGGNSSLNLIYDAFTRLYIFGSLGSTPWGKLDKVKILCPVPGYDRHFAICEELGFEMINIPMTDKGPDMNMIEEMVAKDASIKAILCVPLYSNPDGICYSDETVERLAKMPTAAEDFKIFWDDAYAIHHVYEEIKQLNIFEACKKYGTDDRILYFFSTSKVTFPGSGVALIASGDRYITDIRSHFSKQTIGYNKVNQLRTYCFFRTPEGIREHMRKLGNMLKEKFDIVLSTLDREFKDTDLLSWHKPMGGYFISVYTMEGCAKETVRLAKEAGLTLTNAGASYPYGKDPHDSNIRIAPSYPSCEDLKTAMEIFCICVKLAAVNKLLEK